MFISLLGTHKAFDIIRSDTYVVLGNVSLPICGKFSEEVHASGGTTLRYEITGNRMTLWYPGGILSLEICGLSAPSVSGTMKT
jgi:hypothetical protein